MTDICQSIAGLLNLPLKGVSATIALLDEGATVPFISRYRKERTGALDEVAIRNIETALNARRQLEARKEFVRNAISEAGAMTEALSEALDKAASMTEVEDIYLPYKPKRSTRASAAKSLGLEPLAKIIMSGRTADVDKEAARFTGKDKAESIEKAIAGASDIIAEWASENTRLRNAVRGFFRRKGSIRTSAVKDKAEELSKSALAQYTDFNQAVSRCSSHQYLALRRAEREGLIKVKFILPDEDIIERLWELFIPRHATDDCAAIIEDAIEDSYKRLLRPSVENEIAAEMKAEADDTAINIFAGNLRQLLLAAPLANKRILALDPGFRTGCKVACLDAQGQLLGHSTIYPCQPKNDTAGACEILSGMIAKYSPEAVAIGNGTASRETEQFIRQSGLFSPDDIYIVNESGASVYSASDIARSEFPDKDVTVRGTVSIGRRLIDPLAELVKIDPKSIGVGQYQHDVDQTKLKEALDYTVMSCVNNVGVNVNTASEQLLSYVSGIGPKLASNIIAYRSANGPFRTRAELRKVPRLGDKAFELAAGFLRIPDGDNALDNTGIHPESYGIVTRIASMVKLKVADLPRNNAVLDTLDAATLSQKDIGGKETIEDIISELRRPGRDPRTDTDDIRFKPSVDSFEELSEGLIVECIVNNITAFGAFVDLGIHENGLIHISQIDHKRVTAVTDVLKLGQKLRARVISIDKDRHRISLSLKDV